MAELPHWSIQGFADHLGVCREKIYQAIRKKQLKAKKFGNRTIITRQSGEAFIEAMPDLVLEEVTAPKLSERLTDDAYGS